MLRSRLLVVLLPLLVAACGRSDLWGFDNGCPASDPMCDQHDLGGDGGVDTDAIFDDGGNDGGDADGAVDRDGFLDDGGIDTDGGGGDGGGNLDLTGGGNLDLTGGGNLDLTGGGN